MSGLVSHLQLSHVPPLAAVHSFLERGGWGARAGSIKPRSSKAGCAMIGKCKAVWSPARDRLYGYLQQ
jgi:hypothetical protein